MHAIVDRGRPRVEIGSMSDNRLYTVLGVAKDAPADDIKKAYRKLARKHHPDVNPGDKAAEARFKEISAAYDVLSDPEKRKLYDEFGEDSTRLGFDPSQARAHQEWERRAQWHGGSRSAGFDAEDLFRELYGRGRGGGQRGWPGEDMHAELQTDFRTAALGGERELRFGDGRTLTVRIPPGVSDGGTIRLRGQGSPGTGGMPAGDLLITLRVAPDPVFRSEGADLHVDLPLTVGEAIRGAKVKVPTLDGRVTVQVPPGSQSGRVLRVRGKGIARRDRQPGDLLVHLQVVVPENGDLGRLGDAIEAIDAAYAGDVRESLFGEVES